MNKTDNCHCHRDVAMKCLCNLCENGIGGCEHCTQQKDAGVEQILQEIKKAYDNGDPTAWGWGLQELEKLVTQARQQAFQESLEAAPTKHETVGTPETYYNTAIDDYRANIEKLKQEVWEKKEI